MTFVYNPEIVPAFNGIINGIAVALTAEEVAIVDAAPQSPRDIVEYNWSASDSLVEKEAVTRMQVPTPTTSASVEDYYGPVIHYLWRLRTEQPVIELDLLINNGSLDSEVADDSTINPLYPSKDTTSVYVTAPAGFGWVSKVPHQKVTEDRSVGSNIYRVDLLGTKIYQAGLVWIPLYLVPNQYLNDGRSEGTVVDNYINNLPFVGDTSAGNWCPFEYNPNYETSTGAFSIFDQTTYNTNAQNQYNAWVDSADGDASSFASKLPANAEFVAYPNGQQGNGYGMDNEGPVAPYQTSISNADMYNMTLQLLQVVLHRPNRGFFNHRGFPSLLATIKSDILNKSLFNESQSPSWNLVLNGTPSIFNNTGNPYGVSSVLDIFPSTGIGSFGVNDAQHYGRAYNIATYLAQRFDDSFGRMVIRWMAATMRLDVEGFSDSIGNDAIGSWSNLGREHAFAVSINALDYHFNQTPAASAYCADFVSTCETFQASSWPDLGGDGQALGGMICWRGGSNTPENKEVNLAKLAWGWNTGNITPQNEATVDYTAFDTSSVTQGYQEMLLFQALVTCSAVGVTVQDQTLSGHANFIVDNIGPNQISPWYRFCPSNVAIATEVNPITGVSGGYFTDQGGSAIQANGGVKGITGYHTSQYGSGFKYWTAFLPYLYACPTAAVATSTKDDAFNALKYGGGRTTSISNGATYTLQEMFNGTVEDQGGYNPSLNLYSVTYRHPFFWGILGQTVVNPSVNNNSNQDKENQKARLRTLISDPTFPY